MEGHRTWLVLVVVLGWLFLYRYRIMGWLLSKAITFQLSKTRSKQDPITVRVERVSLQPLRFLNVELSSSGATSWTLALTSVAVQSHIKEFFESFGLVKICVLVIDEVIGDVSNVDPQQLQEMLLPKRRRPRSATKPKTNPICFARFVDLKVESIRLRAACLGAVTELKCHGLFVGITDVFVQRNMLQLKVQARSVVVQSCFEVHRRSSVWRELMDERGDTESKDGALVDVPNAEVLMDLNLTTQRFLGCKVFGCKEKTTSVVLSSAFVEQALTVRNELIQKALAAFNELDTTPIESEEPAPSAVVRSTPIEIIGLHVAVTIVDEVDAIGCTALQCCATISHVTYTKQDASSEAAAEREPSDTTSTLAGSDSSNMQMDAAIQNMSVSILGDLGGKVLSVYSCEIRATQDTIDHGTIHCAMDEAEVVLSHRSDTICRSLLAVQERVKTLQNEAKVILRAIVMKEPRLFLPKPSLQNETRINWNAQVDVMSWVLSFESSQAGHGKHDFTACGTTTSIQTPLSPSLGENGSSRIERSIAVQSIDVEIEPSGNSSHSAVFGGVKVAMSTLLDPAQGTKLTNGSFGFDHVSINGLSSESEVDRGRFPAVLLHKVTIEREEKAAADVTELNMDIHIDATKVKWHYMQHKAFLVEWTAIKSIIDQLDHILSGSSQKKKHVEGQTNQPPMKNTGTNLYLKHTEVDIIDIPDVAPLATVCLEDARASHRITQLSIVSAFNCVNAKLSWGSQASSIEMADAAFQNRKTIGRQRYLTKVPAQTDIRFSRLKMHLRPRSRMLLLFLRLDQLISDPADKADGAKKSVVQGISFACGIFTVELEGAESHEKAACIQFTTFGVKLTRSTPREITDVLLRVASCVGKEGLASHSFAEVAHQVMVMEGTASASAISVSTPLKRIIDLQDTQIHFSITDVEWNQFMPLDQEHKEAVSRTTSFDLSTLTARINLMLEKKPMVSLLALTPILKEAFDTKPDSEDTPPPTNLRLRYVGNFDIGIQEATVVYPYGGTSCNEDIGRKAMRVVISDTAFRLRQFQSMELRCSPLRVMLEDATATENGTDDLNGDTLQLLYLPEVKVHSDILWRSDLFSEKQQYSLSLDVSFGNTASVEHPPQVPLAEEALIALNWDCVYPWLIYMTTDDDDNENSEHSDVSGSSEESDTGGLQCVGVQWDLLVTLVQVAWWDTATQEVGMLVVANDFLSHGVVRLDETSLEIDELDRQWKIWETTLYLNSFQGYLLHVDDDFRSTNTAVPDVLPFASEISSNFSLEMVGTSYRNTYTPGDDEDWDALDDEVTALFAPATVTFFEKIHDGFVPIDYEFSIATPAKVVSTPEPVGRLPLLHVPVSIRASSASLSPPKSPRSAKNGAQTIRNRLSRMKRRSASMDNLFLKDGSCPIQVDSMRLLWTIQTRDSVFYMVSTTLDSLRLLAEAKQSYSVDPQPDVSSTIPLSPRRDKRSSVRSASVVSSTGTVETIPNPEVSRGMNRRGSTRDTLLDLLNQGKLGTVQDPECNSSSTSLNGDDKSDRGSQGEEPDAYESETPKTIAVKTYTVDVHDAQINVREEGTRSNMLLASKHIHFEIGSDASDTNTIANLTFDNVTAHIAPIDVDISAGVLWYSHKSIGSNASGSALLKQIMEECSLTTTYTHNRITGSTSTAVDLSFLQLSTDRHQFYQLLNVIRHVLLAPPSIARRPRRTYTPRINPGSLPESPHPESGEIMIFVPPSPTSNVNVSSTKKLHVLLEEELRNREIRKRGTASRSNTAMSALKSISFKVVGMQWRLRLSPEIAGADHEFMEMRIQGFTGCHTYYTNHYTKLTLNLQWLEVNNMHPGPSCAAFEDPMAVLKAKLLVDKRLDSGSKLGLGSQKGMLVVRAESGPVVRVLGQKLRVLEVLEVSMFPEVANMIVIQLAADFYEMIYKFFFENTSPDAVGNHSMNSEQVLFGRKAATSPTPASTAPTNSGVVSSPKGASSPYSTKARTPTISASPSQTSLRPLHKTHSAGSASSMILESSGSFYSGGPNSPTSSSADDSSVAEESDSTADNCELFYVKYVRVGNVRLRINCNGFFVNLSHFDLDLPPYVCQSKLCTTKKLLQKFESHLKWYITKESASSGLSQFKNKLLKWTPSSSASDKKDKSKKQEEDTAAANAQVLFGPYSGTT